jgi:hypothetical protein
LRRLWRGWLGGLRGLLVCTEFHSCPNQSVFGRSSNQKLTWTVEPVHRPDSLSITYAKPTYSLDFYILRASFSKPDLPQSEPPPEPEAEPTKSWLGWLSPQKDLTKKTETSRPKEEIIGTLESIKGELCVKAKGTFSG